MTALLLIGLTACAGNKPVAHVPADLVRPPCRPAASLMVAPAPLPPIKPGDRMVEVSARDTVLYNSLRRLAIDLQRHVAKDCQ